MREPSGHVTVNERVPTDRFNEYVEEKIAGWIQDHRIQQTDDLEYEVAFFDEDSLGEVSCLIVVHTDGQLWRAWETADNPRAALSRSLECLTVNDENSSAEHITH
jgi:hypothetical protein